VSRARTEQEALPAERRRTIGIEQVGVEEVSIVPWMMMIPRRLARRVGITKQWATMIVVLAGLFSTSVTITIIVVSLDTIADDLDSSVSALNWSITGPMLAFGVVGPAFGKLGDLYGHKRVYVWGLGLAGFFAICTAFAWDASSMLTFRILSAVAGSATGPAAMAYVNRLFEPHERVRPLSLWSFVTAGAPVLGVVIGAPLIETIGWRTIFIGQAPLSLFGAALAWRLLPQTTRVDHVKFDVAGSATLGVGATLVLLAVNRGTVWGWTSWPIMAATVVGVASLAAFVRVESRAEAPLMPLVWWRTRNIALPIASQAFANFAYMGGFIIVPQLLGDIGLSPSQIGWLIIARPLAFSVAAPSFSSVTMRVGERVSGVVGAGCVAASMFLLASVGNGSGNLLIIAGLAMSGIGLGIASPALTALVANAVDEQDLGVAAAMQQLMSQMGAVVGTTVMISIHESMRAEGNIASYGHALTVGAVSACAAMVFAWFVRSTDRREEYARL
jgi:MFS family permease